MNRKSLGSTIRKIRKLRGLTQKQLAEKIGYSPNAVAMLERGERGCNLVNLNLISKALKIPVVCFVVFGLDPPSDVNGKRLVLRIRSLIETILKTKFQ